MSLSKGCLQNKEPLRSPKTPNLENKDPPLFYIFFGGTTLPSTPEKIDAAEKSPFSEEGGESHSCNFSCVQQSKQFKLKVSVFCLYSLFLRVRGGAVEF